MKAQFFPYNIARLSYSEECIYIRPLIYLYERYNLDLMFESFPREEGKRGLFAQENPENQQEIIN